MQRNNQAPEKRVSGNGTHLVINSIFHTIQGEGPFTGTPAVFVRLAGCNLQCPQCDTEYTKRITMDIAALRLAVRDARPHTPDGRWWAPCDLVVITGGEPFRQPIGLLIKALIDDGYRVQVETNGSLYQPAVNYLHPKLTIVCSPKTGVVNRDLLPWIAAFKYVAAADNISPDDGLPTHALEHPVGTAGLYRPPPDHDAEIYLQPVDEQDEERNRNNRDAVVAACLKHGHRLCLQTHKLVGVP